MAAVTFTDDRYRDHVLTKVELLYPDDDTTPTAINALELDSRAVTIDAPSTTLTTEGTTATYETNSVDRVSVLVEQSVFQAALDRVALTTATSGVTGEAARSYFSGDYKTLYYGLKLHLKAVDLDNGASVNFQVVFPKVQVQEYVPITNATRKSIVPQQIRLNAIKTSTDLLAAALPSVPSGGAYYWRSKMSA